MRKRFASFFIREILAVGCAVVAQPATLFGIVYVVVSHERRDIIPRVRFNLIALFLFLYKRRNEGRRHFWYERRNERRRNENIRHRCRFQYRFDFIVINLHDVQYWFVFFVFHEHAIPVFVVLFLQKRAEMPKQDSAGAWRERSSLLKHSSFSLYHCDCRLRRQLVHSLIVGCPNADRFLLAKLFEKNRQA